jgi:hypothetical protein
VLAGEGVVALPGGPGHDVGDKLYEGVAQAPTCLHREGHKAVATATRTMLLVLGCFLHASMGRGTSICLGGNHVVIGSPGPGVDDEGVSDARLTHQGEEQVTPCSIKGSGAPLQCVLCSCIFPIFITAQMVHLLGCKVYTLHPLLIAIFPGCTSLSTSPLPCIWPRAPSFPLQS